MPKQELKMRHLGDVDGGALGVAVDNALKLVTQDMTDRPALNAKRKVVLTIELQPEVDKNSNHFDLEEVNATWHVQTKVPAIGKADTKMKPQHNGLLSFHSDLPDAPDDETIMDEAERRRLERREDRDD